MHYISPLYRKINGREFDRLVRRATASQRGSLAVELEEGQIEITRLTRRQALFLAKASFGYENTARKLSADQFDLVRKGALSLSAAHNKPNDAQIERFIQRAGEDRVFAALDKMTAPAIAAE
jgi:hypothetical protein